MLKSLIIPYWLKVTVFILTGNLLGIWLATENTRALDNEYLIQDMRKGMNRATRLLAGLVSESVITGDERKTEALIKQYVSNWPEVTYVHILDEDGRYFTEWQKKPIKFGKGILKFETIVEYGGVKFGTISIYTDLNEFYQDMAGHIEKTRRRTAFILLAITLFLVSSVNYLSIKEFNSSREQKPGVEQ